MATKNKVDFSVVKAPTRNSIFYAVSITLGGSGAISSVAGDLPVTTTAGTFGVIKTAAKTGRYSVKLDKKYKSLRMLGAPTIFGPADAGFGNTNANLAQVRNAALDGFDVQLMLASSGVDTDGASGYRIDFAFAVKEF
jgi:hypothetical protein